MKILDQTHVLTVAQLRAALADVPDDDHVLMILETGAPGESAGWLTLAEHDPFCRTFDLRGTRNP